jgi:hypothetical protein
MTFLSQFSKIGQPKTSFPWLKMRSATFGGDESLQLKKSRRPSFSSPQMSFLVVRFCQIDPKNIISVDENEGSDLKVWSVDI